MADPGQPASSRAAATADPPMMHGAKGRFARFLVSQFGNPRGWFGRLAGWVMAHRRSNRERNRWTVELLELHAGDSVLELGCGPGLALAAAIEKVGNGLVVGVDHSATVLAQAAKRNRAALADGRLRLVCRGVENLPADLRDFQAVFAVNSAGFWQEPVLRLAELRGRMRAGGRIALTEQPRLANATEEGARMAAKRLAEQLQQAGFEQVRVEVATMTGGPVVCALGRAPG